MPPKAPTGAGRGRGRGRGRGGASGQTRDVVPSTTDQTMTDVPDSSTPAPVAQMTSTASTPAPTAQMTPASSTQPKPPTRTSSLRRGGATASPAPSAARAKKAVIPGPKAVRRSKEDREKIQAETDKRRAEEARTALREAKRAGKGRGGGDRGRGRGGKARGGFMGDSERTIREQVASGPFSAGMVSAEGSYRSKRTMGGGGGGGGFGGGGGGGGGGGYGGGNSGSRIKSEGGSYVGGGGGGPAEDGGYISSDLDELDEGPRKNIDFIDLVSDDEDAVRGGRAVSAVRNMAPIRVTRIEHKDREKPVAADSKTKEVLEPATATEEDAAPTERDTPTQPPVSKGKQRAKDVQVVRSERKWKGAWEDSDDDQIDVKPEPVEDTDMTAVPEAGVQIKESSSPEAKRKSKIRIQRSHGLPTEAPSHQTQEEKREWERHHLDLEILRQELGEIVLPTPKPTATTAEQPIADAEGDTKMEDQPLNQATVATQEAPIDKRADRVYLFQFPPILPELAVSAAVKKEPPSSPELRKANTAADPISIDDTPITSAPQKPVKVEDDIPISASRAAAGPASAGQARALPSGMVGKLRVHASGRTTLDWGGTNLQIGMGTDVQFLQDVIVTKFYEQEKEKEREGDEIGGEVLGLGQVRGKFVVTPDWEEIVGVRI